MATSNWTSIFGRGRPNPVDPLSQLNADPAMVSAATPSSVPGAIPFNAGGVFANSAALADVTPSAPPKLKTLVTFAGADGEYPGGSLIADAAGDFFGTTNYGGADGDGTVFEIAKTAGGYASTPTTLVSFTGANGAEPSGSLIADAAGDLFGATAAGGAGGDGTVFEIAKTADGYASAPTTLVSFTSANGEYPSGSLIADAAGDLFGTTAGGGADGDGTVFEIAKTADGYASAPTTLVSFTGADGQYPHGSLIADAAGDLFGTTLEGGVNNAGTVFEIVKTAGGYASAPTTLVSFKSRDGRYPEGSLIIDAAGDLFGTTDSGGANHYGTVFEIAKTADGYARAPTTLVSFTGADGAHPLSGLIADAAGDLFGTTAYGGADGDGTVFEIAKTAGGYASPPTTLVSFTGANGMGPESSLIADAAGGLFGTTRGGGADGVGTVFKITHSGFVVSPSPAAAFVQAMASHGADKSGSTNPPMLAARNETAMFLSRPQIV